MCTQRRIPSGSTPASMLLPHSTVSGRSVMSRTVTRDAEDAALLLDGAAVGQHAARVPLERDEVEEAERLGDDAPASPPSSTPKARAAPAVRGWTLTDDRQRELVGRRARAPRPGALEARLDVDVLLAVQRDEQVAARLELRAASSTSEASIAVGVAVEHLVDRVAGHEDRARRRCPRAAGSRGCARVYGISTSLEWSMTRRLTSSGTRSSKQRLPASMWKTRDPEPLRDEGGEAAVRVAEDEQAVGALLARAGASTRREDLADLLAEASPSDRRGSGRARARRARSKNTSLRRRVEVLPGVDEHVVAEPRRDARSRG